MQVLNRLEGQWLQQYMSVEAKWTAWLQHNLHGELQEWCIMQWNTRRVPVSEVIDIIYLRFTRTE